MTFWCQINWYYFFKSLSFCRCYLSLPPPYLSLALSHTNNPSITSQHGSDSSGKWEFKTRGSSPHEARKCLLLFMDTRFHIQRGGGTLHLTCCNWHVLEKFEAGGRNSLSAAEQLYISQRHFCLPHICISLKQWNINY